MDPEDELLDLLTRISCEVEEGISPLKFCMFVFPGETSDKPYYIGNANKEEVIAWVKFFIAKMEGNSPVVSNRLQ